ncbi:hypothetical protein L484_021955 [Morus notabilis]|uniref:Uncharacterized protein n=1 Tax=Morus notabilis TaxID=981085 RepID=W9QUX2_9ROSA|nr:hypothetical protein L484_021955 [Morus notabilis]
MEQTASQKSTASFVGLFSGADRVDYVLMFFGSVGTCVHGAALPVWHRGFVDGFVENDVSAVLTTLSNSTSPESKALVTVLKFGMEAFAVVPLRRKLGHHECVQCRIRRPFTVSEVEALVRAVEKLRTGRAPKDAELSLAIVCCCKIWSLGIHRDSRKIGANCIGLLTSPSSSVYKTGFSKWLRSTNPDHLMPKA